MKFKKTSLIFLFATPFVLSGCTTINPYTGESELSKTSIGTGIGAAGGALIGQLVGGNTTATLVGAGIGAAAGGIMGNYMDRQANDLRAQLQGTGVRVIKNADYIQLVMPGDITFKTNSSDIRPQFYDVLNSVGIVLKKYNRTIVRVTGYTDNTGTVEYNQQLSESRASSVANYLAAQGVSSNRFSVLGYGERGPVASNQTAQGRAQNRRVEIAIQPIN